MPITTKNVLNSSHIFLKLGTNQGQVLSLELAVALIWESRHFDWLFGIAKQCTRRKTEETKQAIFENKMHFCMHQDFCYFGMSPKYFVS